MLYNESLLLHQLALGNADAFRVIYDRFYSLLFYYTRRKIEDPEKANEITADCFIKFWRSGKKEFDSLEGVKAYLLRAANNAAINAYRDLQTELRHQKDVIVYCLESEQTGVSEEDEYRAALMSLVLGEIEKLPKQCKLIFKLAYFENLKNDEIAQRLNLSFRTVRNQKNRALNLLRVALLKNRLELSVILFFLFHRGF